MAEGSSTSNIWIAASDGSLERVKQLIEVDGLSPNVKDQNGYTPVHAAVSWGHASLLRYLVSKGGDINVTDNDGDTPLFTVENLDMCRLVLELGGDPSLINDASQTAAQSLQEEHPTIAAFLSNLTGETLSLPSDPTPETPSQPTVASLPDDILSMDPASRAAAIETNVRAGALLERVQAILMDADARGEDPEERIRAVVDEAVRETMQAGRDIAEMQVAQRGEQQVEDELVGQEEPEKRQRQEEPER